MERKKYFVIKKSIGHVKSFYQFIWRTFTRISLSCKTVQLFHMRFTLECLKSLSGGCSNHLGSSFYFLTYTTKLKEKQSWLIQRALGFNLCIFVIGFFFCIFFTVSLTFHPFFWVHNFSLVWQCLKEFCCPWLPTSFFYLCS